MLLSHDYIDRSEEQPDAVLLDRAIQAVERYVGPISGDVETSVVVRWGEAVPAMPSGRFAQIADFTRKVDRTQRVQLASDLDRIPGLNGALVSGREAARRIATAVPLHFTTAGFSRMNATLHQRACVWLGLVFFPLFALGLLSPARCHHLRRNTTAIEVARLYDEHRIRIRVGVSILTAASPFLAFYGAALSHHIRRTVGSTPLATAQSLVAACLILEFIFPN